MSVAFEVVSTAPVRLNGPPELLACQLMSPYVWGSPQTGLSVLVRAVPQPGSGDAVTGRIWFGRATDDEGLVFDMDAAPAIAPGPDPLDINGCEDPTVVPTADGCVVYYTGLDAQGNGRMLYAAGPDARSLTKRGVALDSFKTETNTKEATVEVTAGGAWRLFYEYAADNRSKIGLAFADGPAGPWTEQPHPFEARAGEWDDWHLSTGPLLMTDPTRPVMFYNGSNPDAHWGIGWIAFSEDLTQVVARCDAPLIGPPAVAAFGREIAFAASVMERDGDVLLYYSRDDAELERAVLRRR